MSDSGPHRQTDYGTLSLAEVRAGLDAVAREAQATFGGLDRLPFSVNTWRARRAGA